MKEKQCTQCGNILPASINFFHIDKAGKYGLTSKCIKCRRENDVKYKKKNKEKIVKYKKEYNIKNNKTLKRYKEIHRKIRKNKPKEKYCIICNEPKKLELANISGEYNENINNYIWLCNDCHHLFDRTRRLFIHA